MLTFNKLYEENRQAFEHLHNSKWLIGRVTFYNVLRDGVEIQVDGHFTRILGSFTSNTIVYIDTCIQSRVSVRYKLLSIYVPDLDIFLEMIVFPTDNIRQLVYNNYLSHYQSINNLSTIN